MGNYKSKSSLQHAQSESVEWVIVGPNSVQVVNALGISWSCGVIVDIRWNRDIHGEKPDHTLDFVIYYLDY